MLLLFLLLLTTTSSSICSSLLKSRRFRYYINLTNGIEALPLLVREKGITLDEISYVRIQSSHCEKGDHVSILNNLDYNFMMNMALGNVNIMYDFGSRGTGSLMQNDARDGIPRAMWWGTELIRHTLETIWDLPIKSTDRRMVKGYNVAQEFNERIQTLPKAVKKRIKYFRPYIQTDQLQWYNVYCKTMHDGEKEWYAKTLKEVNRKSENPLKLDEDPLLHLELELEGIEDSVARLAVPDGMYIYKHTDFEGFGRDCPKKK